MIDTQVPGREAVLLDRGIPVDGRSALRLRPSRYATLALELARAAALRPNGQERLATQVTGGQRWVARAGRGFDGHVHTVTIWTGAEHEPIPSMPTIGHWTWHAGRQESRWTDELLELHGLSAQDTLERHGLQPFLQRLHPEDAMTQARLVQQVDQASIGTILGMRFRATTDDHQHRLLHGFGRVLLDEHGDRVWRGTTLDITTCTADEATIRSTLDALFPSKSAVQAALVDLPSCRLLRWLHQGLPEVQWPESGSLQQAFAATDRDDSRLNPAYIAALPPATPVEFDVRLHTSSCTVSPYRLRVQLVGAPSGTAPGLVTFCRATP